jgi:hypothetical protein
VQEVEVDVVGLEALEALVELRRDKLGRARRRVRSLADEDELLAGSPTGEQRAERALALLAVVVSGIEARAAVLDEPLPERRLDPGCAHRDPRDGFLDARKPAVPHRNLL